MSDRSFGGKTVVLTGASAGIGREIALLLARERPRLVLAARDAARLEEVAGLCRAAGAEALVVPTDVADESACRALVAAAVEHFGTLDVLLLNAGQEMLGRVDEIEDLAVLERLMRVNFFGCVAPALASLPHLVASRGRIVVVSSLAGLTGVPTRAGYAATKHALHGFFDSLRTELHGSGVSITLVCPDFVQSELHQRSLGPDGRPHGSSPVDPSRIMSAATCARLIVRAARARRRLSLLSLRGRVGRWVRVGLPGVIDWIARRSVARGY